MRAAQAVRDYILSQKIHCLVQQEGGVYQLYSPEDLADQASLLLRQFLANPNDPRYRIASWQQGETNTSSDDKQSMFRSEHFASFINRAGITTKVFVAVSIVISILTNFGSNDATFYFLFEADKILSGQLHRLVTPIFLHFSVWGIFFLHLLFNMMWLWEFGGSLEKSLGHFWLVYAIVFIAILSNACQFVVSGPAFGGMSGVVFGLLGYLWIRPKIDDNFPLMISPSLVNFFLLWLVIGFTGILGNMANTAHLTGLISGICLSLLDVKVFKF
jgi:GlpG protein